MGIDVLTHFAKIAVSKNHKQAKAYYQQINGSTQPSAGIAYKLTRYSLSGNYDGFSDDIVVVCKDVHCAEFIITKLLPTALGKSYPLEMFYSELIKNKSLLKLFQKKRWDIIAYMLEAIEKWLSDNPPETPPFYDLTDQVTDALTIALKNNITLPLLEKFIAIFYGDVSGAQEGFPTDNDALNLLLVNYYQHNLQPITDEYPNLKQIVYHMVDEANSNKNPTDYGRLNKAQQLQTIFSQHAKTRQRFLDDALFSMINYKENSRKLSQIDQNILDNPNCTRYYLTLKNKMLQYENSSSEARDEYCRELCSQPLPELLAKSTDIELASEDIFNFLFPNGLQATDDIMPYRLDFLLWYVAILKQHNAELFNKSVSENIVEQAINYHFSQNTNNHPVFFSNPHPLVPRQH